MGKIRTNENHYINMLDSIKYKYELCLIVIVDLMQMKINTSFILFWVEKISMQSLLLLKLQLL